MEFVWGKVSVNVPIFFWLHHEFWLHKLSYEGQSVFLLCHILNVKFYGWEGHSSSTDWNKICINYTIQNTKILHRAAKCSRLQQQRGNGTQNELFKVKSPIKFWGLVVFILHKIEIEPERVCKWYVSPLWRGFPSVSPSFFVVSTRWIFSGKPSPRYVDFRCFCRSERPGRSTLDNWNKLVEPEQFILLYPYD